MKELYQKEVSQIHVPAALLEKTKAAMREEQEKSELPKKSKVVSFKVISIAAAAAVSLFAISEAVSRLPARRFFVMSENSRPNV